MAAPSKRTSSALAKASVETRLSLPCIVREPLVIIELLSLYLPHNITRLFSSSFFFFNLTEALSRTYIST